jgi:hypothetical protein
MSALAPLVDPSTAGAGLSVTASDPQAIPPLGSAVPASMQLSRNPMLPAHPLGAYTDSTYEANDAVLRNQIAKQYADLLQQLGYRDDAGNFIMGSVESEANKAQTQLAHQQSLAAQGVTDDAQRNGTLFSGMRGTLQARAEDPYVRQEADLAGATPLTIQKLYEQASGLTNDYILGQNQELASAAQRAAAGLTLNPPAGDGGGGGGGAPPDPTAGASLAPIPGQQLSPELVPGAGLGRISPQQQAANAMMAAGLTPTPARTGGMIAV